MYTCNLIKNDLICMYIQFEYIIKDIPTPYYLHTPYQYYV